MVRILVLSVCTTFHYEEMEYQLLDRMSYKRFCGLETATNVPDRTTVRTFENRIGEGHLESPEIFSALPPRNDDHDRILFNGSCKPPHFSAALPRFCSESP